MVFAITTGSKSLGGIVFAVKILLEGCKVQKQYIYITLHLAGQRKALPALPNYQGGGSAPERTWRNNMKKLLILSLILVSSALVVPSVEARTTSAATLNAAVPQVIRLRRHRYRTRRVVTRTRITRVGPYRYRETIRTTYLPNGMTRTRVIRRVRLGRWRNY